MKTRDLTLIGVIVAFIVTSAQISIPLGPVPFTLQTMVILTAALVLGAKRGFIATIVYVLLGAIGLPVFANFNGGISAIFMHTGGFIMSFPIMAYIVGKFSELSNKKVVTYLGCIVGVIINFVVGCSYFMYVTEMDLATAMTYTVTPFIFTTIVQIFLAVTLSEKLKNALSTQISIVNAKNKN